MSGGSLPGSAHPEPSLPRLDEKDKAFEWLEMGYEKRYPTMGRLKVGPMLDPLRLDPHLQSLLYRMNFPE